MLNVRELGFKLKIQYIDLEGTMHKVSLKPQLICQKQIDLKKGCALLCAVLMATILTVGSVFSSHKAQAGPALVFDNKSDQIIYAEDPDQLWHPASLTKLMTAYLVFEALKSKKITMDSRIVNSKNARRQPPSKIGLPLGATMPIKAAIEILIVKSANDVAVMIAEKIGGSEKAFIRKMNKTAARLGMRNTEFYNPHGLPHPQQVTTARDMAMLAKALIRDFPEYNHLFTLGSVKVGKRRLRSHNDLLRTYEGADGMKTGFICDSGFNVVASATRGGRRLIAVVLGAKSTLARRKRATSLLDHGFKTYWWKTLFPINLGPKEMSTVSAAPGKMRKYVCNYRPKKKRKYKKKKKKKLQKAKNKKATTKKVAKKKPVKKKIVKKKTVKKGS